MPVTSIGDITTAITDLITHELSVALLPARAFPDSMMREEREGISFYLYHIKENARYKNVPPAGNDLPPVKLNPMGLDLYYQLTAYSSVSDGSAAIIEQQLMSVALKTLHDAPLLSFGADKFRVTLQPVPFNDAVHNWTAGSLPMKLSAYYEVSPVLLEPEKPTLISGRVLVYGNYIFTSGIPRITASKSTIKFKLPSEPDARQVTAQPGQAAADGEILFEGTGFIQDAIEMRLFNFMYKENLITTASWNLTGTSEEIKVTVQKDAAVEESGLTVEVLPGIYTAQVVIKKTISLPGGEIREFKQESNQFPFIILPVAEGALTGLTITVDGFGFQTDAELSDYGRELTEVYFGQYKMKRNGVPGGDQGSFQVDSRIKLVITLPATIASGVYPLRVLIAGAESLPSWITIP